LHWFLLLFWLYLALYQALAGAAVVRGASVLRGDSILMREASVPVRAGSLFRLQSGSKPISVFRVRGNERSCMAFTVAASSMETDSLMEMVE
jgi:hypothetical protein